MELIGFGERRYFQNKHELFAIFSKEDGSEFELPVSTDQMAVLLAESGQAGGGRVRRRPAQTSSTSTEPGPAPMNSPSPGNPLADEEEDEDVGPIRLASVAADYEESNL